MRKFWTSQNGIRPNFKFKRTKAVAALAALLSINLVFFQNCSSTNFSGGAFTTTSTASAVVTPPTTSSSGNGFCTLGTTLTWNQEFGSSSAGFQPTPIYHNGDSGGVVSAMLVATQSRVYVMNGDAGDNLNQLYYYDLILKQWTQVNTPTSWNSNQTGSYWYMRAMYANNRIWILGYSMLTSNITIYSFDINDPNMPNPTYSQLTMSGTSNSSSPWMGQNGSNIVVFGGDPWWVQPTMQFAQIPMSATTESESPVLSSTLSTYYYLSQSVILPVANNMIFLYGSTADTPPTHSAILYNLNSNSVRTVSSVGAPNNKLNSAAVTNGSFVYLAGGTGGDTSNYIYNLGTDTWSTIDQSSCAGPVGRMALSQDVGTGAIFGNAQGTFFLNYTTKLWTQIASVPNPGMPTYGPQPGIYFNKKFYYFGDAGAVYTLDVSSLVN